VAAQVPVNDSPRIRMAASARMVVSGSGAAPAALQVIARPMAVQSGTATVPVRLAFRTPPSYPVGAPVQVEIDAESHSRVVLVPASAVVHEGNETAVFVVVDKKAQRRAVTIGVENGRVAEIAKGLKAGELVITAGQNGLPDGATISIGPSGGDADDEGAARGAGAKSGAKPQ
jgi:multidrug efflux pump subunit AcrA (membrane-fusion protein)